MEHQESDDARKWSERLELPLPGRARKMSMTADEEMDQLKYL